MPRKQKVLAIVGPTSSGKSALAVELAQKFDGEIISADSRQVYKGLDIGTGKITKREMRGVRHHLLDVASPKKVISAHEFARLARRTIEDIGKRGKLPILVGGTGFYIDAVLGRIILPDVPPDAKARARFEKMDAVRLFALLKRKDPRRARTIDPRNKRRLIRALEIIEALGKVPARASKPLYDATWIGLSIPKDKLEKKISARLLVRMKKGMVAEARKLHKAGLSFRRMEQLGLEYRALALFLQRKIDLAEMTEGLDRDIRRYAKRQLTYWKRNKDIQWFAPANMKKILAFVKKGIVSGR